METTTEDEDKYSTFSINKVLSSNFECILLVSIIYSQSSVVQLAQKQLKFLRSNG